MRTSLAVGLAAVLPVLLTGCLADVMVSTAIQGELQAKQLQTATRALNTAKETRSDIEINSALQTFAAEHGRNPSSLEELVPEYLPAVPTHPDGSPYGYDPATGKVLDAPLVAAPAPRTSSLTNDQKMAEITAAINKYGMATGYYPPSLDALVPSYLPTMPLTASGSRFIYDPQTGKLYDPTGTMADKPAPAGGGGALAQTPPQQQAGFQQPRRAPSGVGGGSPVLGETLTGIGISNQLDNMSSAGTSAAGSSARANARGIGAGHDAKQQQAMDELGL
ncbi:MAG: hypothetical protein HUU46_04230 [Candidatus Hydrogenedentes bacterium]|nr:hypothetical protein [Candidatus Hydrogenedentota bacterium]